MGFELASSSWDQDELDAMNRVIDSGFFTMGAHVKQFEEEFANKYGKKYAVMVNSGSSANLLSVASFFYKDERPLKPGDEVIVPAISWATTYFPLMQYGLKLRFVDVELNSLNMDIDQLEKAITPNTRMIVAVSILGNPCALDRIRDICDKHNLYFFEDNCESMGAELAGKSCGSFGDIGTFSFFFSHHISTMEGGILVTDNEELYHIAKSMRAHGWTRDLPDDSKIYQRSEDDYFEAYRFILPGYNVRPLELSGAIGLSQLKKIDKFLSIRRDNALLFQELFADDDRFIIQHVLPNASSSWFAFTIILNPKYNIDRSKVFNALKENDIKFRIITGGNFLRHDVKKYCDYTIYHDLKNANIAHDSGFFIGNHPHDIKEQIAHCHSVLDQAVK